MNCNTCKKLIHTYLDGYLPVGEEEYIFRHLDHCPACTEYYEDMVTVYNHLQEPDREVPAGFTFAWKKALQEEAQKKKRSKVNWRVLVPSIAAGIAGIFVISMLAFGGGTHFPDFNHLGDNALSLEYKMQEKDGQAQQEGEGILGEAEGGGAQIVEGGPMQEVPESDNARVQEEFLEEQQSDTEQDSEGHTSLFDELRGGASTIFEQRSKDSNDARAAVQGDFVEMPEIEVHTEDGEEIYVLDAAELGLDKKILVEYAEKFGVKVTDTEVGLVIEAKPFLLELLLNAYGIEVVEDMDRLEIILYEQNQ